MEQIEKEEFNVLKEEENIKEDPLIDSEKESLLKTYCSDLSQINSENEVK
ncbi:MAG: hypothetical protein MJ252_16235 [archaeon]|nr:hypothetical protein [archaeon]